MTREEIIQEIQRHQHDIDNTAEIAVLKAQIWNYNNPSEQPISNDDVATILAVRSVLARHADV